MRFSAVISNSSGDSHSLVISAFKINEQGERIDTEQQISTHESIHSAIKVMHRFIAQRRTSDTTPPALTPFACEIPIKLQMPFRNGFFRLSGFEVPLETIQNKKVVNIAYLNWKEFRAELDRKYPDGTFVHQGIKDNLMDLWDFVEAQAASIEPWMQDPVNNTLSEFIIYTP